MARINRADLYRMLGLAHEQLGDTPRSLAALATALSLAPEAEGIRAPYADALALSGNYSQALAEFATCGLTPQQAAERQVVAAHRLGPQPDDRRVRQYLVAALGLAPGYERAAVPLVRLDIGSGELNSALATLRQAESAGLDANVARAHEAWIRAAAGDVAGARALVESIPAEVRANDARVAETLRAFTFGP